MKKKTSWHFEEGSLYLGDCLKVMKWLEKKGECVDLVLGSPPYEDVRSYGELKFNLVGEEWVRWMVEVITQSLKICRGLVVFVVGHGKGARDWSGVPALLMADLIRAGITLRSPVIYKRSGIMGSGGSDWLRKDFEWIICATNGKIKLPWSDNTSCGHPPKYAPGGAMSNRTKSGARVNQWGRKIDENNGGANSRRKDGSKENNSRPSHKEVKEYDGVTLANPGDVIDCTPRKVPRIVDQKTRKKIRELMEEEGITQVEAAERLGFLLTQSTSGTDENGVTYKAYFPPEFSNPGDVLDCKMSEAEASDVLDCKAVGGGLIGSNISHDTDAPFPEKIPDFFIRSFCPPGGTVCDPFGGSGSTLAVAVKTGRKFISIDLRESQIELMKRRLIQARARKGVTE